MSTQSARTSAAGARYGRPQEYQSAPRSPLSMLGIWLTRSSQRRVLRELAQDRHLMSDIGLDPEQALREATKPFWRR
jgi:uncharacterized protein YjiS (DUF1127 family)